MNDNLPQIVEGSSFTNMHLLGASPWSAFFLKTGDHGLVSVEEQVRLDAVQRSVNGDNSEVTDELFENRWNCLTVWCWTKKRHSICLVVLYLVLLYYIVWHSWFWHDWFIFSYNQRFWIDFRSALLLDVLVMTFVMFSSVIKILCVMSFQDAFFIAQ
jgi:hypothetical protein